VANPLDAISGLRAADRLAADDVLLDNLHHIVKRHLLIPQPVRMHDDRRPGGAVCTADFGDQDVGQPARATSPGTCAAVEPAFSGALPSPRWCNKNLLPKTWALILVSYLAFMVHLRLKRL
jgi:hypothetical protein